MKLFWWKLPSIYFVLWERPFQVQIFSIYFFEYILQRKLSESEYTDTNYIFWPVTFTNFIANALGKLYTWKLNGNEDLLDKSQIPKYILTFIESKNNFKYIDNPLMSMDKHFLATTFVFVKEDRLCIISMIILVT